MKGKGANKRDMRQTKALEFDDKYRNLKGFKDDLLALRKRYGGGDVLKFRAVGPRSVISYSEKEYDALLQEMLSKFRSLKRAARVQFDQHIVTFMRKYSLSREWKPYITQLVLTGAYDVPHFNFWIERNEDFPDNILIGIGLRTAKRDIPHAFDIASEELQKRLKPRPKRYYGKSYSDIEDPEFIDLIKIIEAPYIHLGSLSSEHEVILYKKAKTPEAAADDIYKSRKVRRGSAKTVKPTFKIQSDKEYFSLTGLGGKPLARAVERLKKQRRKYKRPSS